MLGATGVAPGIARGTAEVAWPSSTISTTLTVNHGLDGTPGAVTVTLASAPPAANQLSLLAGSITSTTFKISGVCAISLNVTLPVSWVAIL